MMRVQETIDADEREMAVQYLIAAMPDEHLLFIFHEAQSSPVWTTVRYLSLGLYVKDLLREGGFAWGRAALDREWDGLVRRAARRVYDAGLT
ncbi:hypothetical protein FGU65_02110 [Methanoculleus sp. FWC-SCC1]|uniref:Uncharacterized protein n=1 Tax=Methanoculleus frigidifontis TaxID=2584085 RepID=A0ABT8M705_9EURY|nr:hypothetical protein [Methanoculleus sp. FWC-SCC1]MDN7023701.1 hypothetical protein [Methanoculleus sp. FWC-SCC1]